jgi:hypothetical protein
VEGAAFLPLPVLRERVGVRVLSLLLPKNPHPCPLPEYREREDARRTPSGVPCIRVMPREERHYEFLEPWWSTDGQGADFHRTFLDQLKTEVSPGHVLYGLPVRMIGRDGASDDTLFEILDGSGRLALVHLTWAKGQERLPWPGTSLYPSFEAFAADVMFLKNRDYLDE